VVNCGMMVQESLMDHELLESHPRARAFVLRRQWKPHCGVFPQGKTRRDLRVCRQSGALQYNCRTVLSNGLLQAVGGAVWVPLCYCFLLLRPPKKYEGA
jgi:hypothetical protein